MSKTYDRKVYFPDEYNKQEYTNPNVQRWKTDPNLHSCDREQNDLQAKKVLDYKTTYIEEFLNKDPIRDWESIQRCIALWLFFLGELRIDILTVQKEKWNVLDCGTKDGQFPQWLATQGVDSIGTEISKDYVKWAQDHGRNVIEGDVCDMPEDWENSFKVVFGHHLLGLTSDYWLGLSEMLRVTQKDGYLVTLNDVPGNPRKHYSYIENANIFNEFTRSKKCDIVFNGRWNQADFPKEWVYIVRKK